MRIFLVSVCVLHVLLTAGFIFSGAPYWVPEFSGASSERSMGSIETTINLEVPVLPTPDTWSWEILICSQVIFLEGQFTRDSIPILSVE